jgi:hypothetical protein
MMMMLMVVVVVMMMMMVAMMVVMMMMVLRLIIINHHPAVERTALEESLSLCADGGHGLDGAEHVHRVVTVPHTDRQRVHDLGRKGGRRGGIIDTGPDHWCRSAAAVGMMMMMMVVVVVVVVVIIGSRHQC